jgi:hypothetical protein
VGIGTFAYSYSRNPPAKIKRLPNNIYLSMQVQASSLMTPEGRETYDKYIQGWSTKGVNIVMREYWGVHVLARPADSVSRRNRDRPENRNHCRNDRCLW